MRRRARLDRFDAAVKDLQKTKVMCFGRDALDAHPCFFAHDIGKILLQIGTEGAAYLRADGFEPEMVCGPNVLAMTSPCDEENALDRLAVVLHAWDEQAVPACPGGTHFAAPGRGAGARSPKRCCARPIPCRWPMPQARQQRSTSGPTRPVCPCWPPVRK